MLSRIGGWWHRIRRWLDPHAWAVRWLGSTPVPAARAPPGLLLVQVDGLSLSRLRDAIDRGRMPFLAGLIARERYRLHSMYGEKGAVPAFGFRDPATGELVTMMGRDAAARVESHLTARDGGLLTGGSAYCDIFTGGAAEAHFCPAALSVRALLPAAGQLVWARLLLVHAAALVQAAALVVFELVLAIADCARGILSGHDLMQELVFVPNRVALCILVRELSVAGARMDMLRGLPVIHLNLVGFDEQAHRRGPGSAFARWALAGIDHAIARLWRAAHASPARDYLVWVYSDHGQEATVSFHQRTGRSLEDALKETLSTEPGAAGFRWIAKGPVGHVYLPAAPAPDELARIAGRLVHEARIPLVLTRGAAHTARAFTAAGTHELPSRGAETLGEDHPFLDEVAVDLVALCHHASAGDIVLSGFSRGGPHVTFPSEEGSHAGPGPEETSAFALLPAEAPLAAHTRSYLRPLDLRQAALAQLGRLPETRRSPPARQRAPGVLRVMTYNVHRCTGIDGVMSCDRIARVIAQLAPDVVALQELDVGRHRTGRIDQAREIAQRLEMEHHFHAALEIEEERYGDAILSRFPMRLVRAGLLPGPGGPLLAERRGALWVAVKVDGREVHVLNTHLGLLPGERLVQVQALLGPEWVGRPDQRGPLVVCGDFNATPSSPAYRRLAARFLDAQLAAPEHEPCNTWFSTWPVGRIDHVFVGGAVTVRHVEVPRTSLARMASDHLPVLADLVLS